MSQSHFLVSAFSGYDFATILKFEYLLDDELFFISLNKQTKGCQTHTRLNIRQNTIPRVKLKMLAHRGSLLQFSYTQHVHVLCVDITQAAILRFHTRLVKDFNILIFSQPARMGEKRTFAAAFACFNQISLFFGKTCKRLSTTEKGKFIFHHSPSISNFPGGNLNKKMIRGVKIKFAHCFPTAKTGGITKELKLDFKQNKN